MKTQAPSIVLRLSLCLCVGTFGCEAGKNYRAGLEAEKRGDASRAYDEYLRAGARQRSGAVASAIERIAPIAASEAESSALAAMDDCRYEDAWRMLMRTLEIQPNHPNAPQLIRRLESEYPGEVAAAKEDYMRRGFTALAMIQPPPVALAQADTQEPRPPEIADEPAPEEKKPAPRPTPKPKPVPTPEPMKAVEAKPTPAQPPPPQAGDAQGPQREYLLVHTLSLRDRRYPRVTNTIDGITIRLKDTDDDMDVDLDLFDGVRRIQKVRELELGRSQTFRGRSGDLYRLSVLGIHHKSRTVRIGIRPA